VRVTADSQKCHCGREQAFEDCCAPLLAGQRRAATAEDLMRSRYCAFVVGDVDYLLASWHPDHRPAQLTLNPEQKWLGLKIKATEAGDPEADRGEVEFVARYKIGGRGHRLHERSRFARMDGRWVYLDGQIFERAR
jgi:SEC-C motif-containing protein